MRQDTQIMLAATHNHAIGVAIRACAEILGRYPTMTGEDIRSLRAYTREIADQQQLVKKLLDEHVCKTEERSV